MITDETMIEMAEAHFACGCNVCALEDENYAYLIAEMAWEDRL